jgi:tellurite resistance protein
MAKPPSVEIAKVLPAPAAGTLTAPEAQAILKVAFLAGEADGRIADEEQDAFSGLCVALRALVGAKDAHMTDEALEKMLDVLTEKLDKSGRAPILAEAATALGRVLPRELAYKVAVGMSLTDLDKSDSEGDFDDELIAALKITEEQADVLAGDVYAALEGEDD